MFIISSMHEAAGVELETQDTVHYLLPVSSLRISALGPQGTIHVIPVPRDRLARARVRLTACHFVFL